MANGESKKKKTNEIIHLCKLKVWMKFEMLFNARFRIPINRER